MADQNHFENFLYSYSVFLFCIVFFIGLGAAQYFSDGNIAGLTAPEPPQPITPSDNGLLDWLAGASNSLTYFFSNLGFFFTLMTVDIGIALVGTLIFSPALIYLIYGFVKLIRG